MHSRLKLNGALYRCACVTSRHFASDVTRQRMTCGLVRRFAEVWLLSLVLIATNLLGCLTQATAQQTPARSRKNMLATVHPLATAAGLAAFRNGGNAVDAAVSAALTLGVVDGFNSGIGGGCFVLIRTSTGELVAIDARETAPKKSHRDMFLVNGQANTQLSQRGALAVATPGALAGYAKAVAAFGKRDLAAAILPAAELADRGFLLEENYAHQIEAEKADLALFPGSRAVLFRGDQPLTVGDCLVQSDLARTYRMIGLQGIDWFYRGEFADKVDEWMRENGGLLCQQDLAEYRTVIREPVVTTYRGYTICGFPPPSSGGVHVAQILNILESFELAELYRSDPALATHVVAEAMKVAFADRAHWLGDPDHVKVPRGLIDKTYARRLAGRIDLAKAASGVSQGIPPSADSDFFGGNKHTTHIAAADAEGNWVAITSTVNTTFGSKVIVPGTGVILNNQMDDFAVAPGVPNAFNLVGGDANSVAGGKRPLSSMSPTIVLHNNQPIMTVGAAGGPRIISSTLLTVVRKLDFDLPLERALGDPRFHHQWVPGDLILEFGFDAVQQATLTKLGHSIRVTENPGLGTCQAIVYDARLGEFIGMAEPRVNGAAAGE